MKNKKVYYLVEGALIASLYIVLTYAQEFLLPGSTSMAIQFRLSEILCILALFTPSAVWGLTLGTLISNLLNVGALPLDIVFGTFATFVAVSLMYKLRDVKWFKLPVLSSFMPVLANGVIIGLELEIFLIEGPFHIGSFLLQGGMVALGELGVCVILGLPFYKLLEHLNLFNKLHKNI
ncbi:MAG: QueT transporter family protein [Ruminococcus sp.]|nr:QueT transporter family protein [Ruminococcus sp.]